MIVAGGEKNYPNYSGKETYYLSPYSQDTGVHTIVLYVREHGDNTEPFNLISEAVSNSTNLSNYIIIVNKYSGNVPSTEYLIISNAPCTFCKSVRPFL